MRPVMHGDVVVAARVLYALPEAARPDAMARMLDEAGAGDRYRKRFGRAHLLFGNGSLMSAAARFAKAAEPGLGDAAYLNCLYHVINALLERRAEK